MKKLLGPLGVGSGAALLVLANLGSYGVGFVRDLVFAHSFGATGISDVYFSAFRLPDFLFNFLALGFISGALLPIFVKNHKQDPEKAVAIFGNFLTIISLLIGFFSLIALVITPFLVGLFYEGDHFSETVQMTRILLFSPLLFTLSNALGMILLAQKRFFSMAISPLFYNFGIIGGILFFPESWGVFSAGVGAIVGAFLHLATRLFDFPKTNIPLCVTFGILPETRRIFWLGMPRMLGLASFQIVLIFFAHLATKSGEGGLAAWEFARNLQSLPVSLFGIALATAVLPFLTDFAQEKKKDQFGDRLEKSFGQILFLTLPAAMGIALMAPILIAVLFERGAFSADATAKTATILLFLAIAIPFESLVHLFSRAFLSFENTIFPTLGKVVFLGGALLSANILSGKMGISALGIAFSAGCFLEILFLAIFLQWRFVSFSGKCFGKIMLRIGIASGIMGIVLFEFLTIFSEKNLLTQFIGGILVSVLVYFSVSFWGNFPEMRDFRILTMRTKGQRRKQKFPPDF